MSNRLQEAAGEVYNNDLILDLVVGHVETKLALKRLMVVSKRFLAKAAKSLYKEVGQDVLTVLSRTGCDYYRLMLYLESIRAIDSGFMGWPTEVDIPSFRRRFPNLKRIDFILIGSSSKSSIYLYDDPILEPRLKQDEVAEDEGLELTYIVGKLFLAVESDVVRLALDNMGICDPNRRFHLIGLRLGATLESTIFTSPKWMQHPLIMLRAEDHPSCDSSVCNWKFWAELLSRLQYLSITTGCNHDTLRQLLEHSPRLRTLKTCLYAQGSWLEEPDIEIVSSVGADDHGQEAHGAADVSEGLTDEEEQGNYATEEEGDGQSDEEEDWDAMFDMPGLGPFAEAHISAATPDGGQEDEIDEDEDDKLTDFSEHLSDFSDDVPHSIPHYCKSKKAKIDRKLLIPTNGMNRRTQKRPELPSLLRILDTCAFNGLEYFAIKCGHGGADWVPDIRKQGLIPHVRHLAISWNPGKARPSYVSRFPTINEWLGHLRPFDLPPVVESIYLDICGHGWAGLNPFHVGLAMSVQVPPHIKILFMLQGGSYTDQHRTWAKHVSEARLHGIQLGHSKQEPGYRLVQESIPSPGHAVGTSAAGTAMKADKVWNTLTEEGKMDALIRAGLIAPGYYPQAALSGGGGGSRESRGYKTPDVLFREMNALANGADA